MSHTCATSLSTCGTSSIEAYAVTVLGSDKWRFWCVPDAIIFFFFFFSSRSFISLCMSLSAQCLFLLCNRAQNRPLFLLPPLRSLDCLKTFHNFGFEPTICCPVVSAWKGHLLIDPPFKSFLPIVENLNLRLQVQHEHLLQLCAPFLLWPIFCPHGIVR